MPSILIKNAQIITMDKTDQILDRADILIDGQMIKEINTDFSATKAASKGKIKADKIIEGEGKLVLPGFINAHTHAGMTLFRGYGENLPLERWLREKIFPMEAKITSKDIYWSTMQAIIEMIRNGITCFLDMYLDLPASSRAVIDSGIRAINCYALADVEPAKKIDLAAVLAEIQQWQAKGEGRLKTIFGPHTIYTCSGLLLRELAKLARKNQIPIHLHLAETKKEVNECKRKYQLTPVELLVKYDFFSGNEVSVAHGIYLTDRDMTILKNHKVSVVSCPSSNLKLVSGICPSQQLLNKGINVALGTDGPASNNSLDILAEAKLASLLAKYYSSDPSALNEYQALKMLTINAAKALGLEKEIGSLEVGKKADLIIMDLHQANMLPEHNLISNLIYSGQSSAMETVICNGKILMEKRKLVLDEEKIIKEFNKRVKILFSHEKESNN